MELPRDARDAVKRKVFFGMSAAVAITQLGSLRAAVAADEAEIGREEFADLRESGEILFDSPYYEHLNEVGSVIAQTEKKRYAYPLRFIVVKGDSPNAFSVPGCTIYVNEPLLHLAENRDELAGVLAHESGQMVLHHVA